MKIIPNGDIIILNRTKRNNCGKGEDMFIDIAKLDTVLADRCWSMSALRKGVSPQTLRKIRAGGEVRPDVVGRIARILDVSAHDITKEV